MKIIIFVLFFLTACTTPLKNNTGRIVNCIDTRDGKMFSFFAHTIVSRGDASAIDIVTTDGLKMTINRSTVTYIDCE